MFMKRADILGRYRYNISGEYDFRLYESIQCGVNWPWVLKKVKFYLVLGIVCLYFYQITMKLPGNKDWHNILKQFAIWPVSNLELLALECWKKPKFDLVSGIARLGSILSLWRADTQDSHNISGKFKSGSHCTIFFEVTCLWLLKKHIWPSGHDGSQVSDRCPSCYLFLLLLLSWIGCGFWLWHALDIALKVCFLLLSRKGFLCMASKFKHHYIPIIRGVNHIIWYSFKDNSMVFLYLRMYSIHNVNQKVI